MNGPPRRKIAIEREKEVILRQAPSPRSRGERWDEGRPGYALIEFDLPIGLHRHVPAGLPAEVLSRYHCEVAHERES
jgi:hypothetical protein